MWPFRSSRRSFTSEEIIERTIYALINEGARVLEEGVALRAADIDTVYVSGYGFPAYRGGRPAASIAPVLPAETTACVVPSPTDRQAATSDESGFERTASAGFSPRSDIGTSWRSQ